MTEKYFNLGYGEVRITHDAGNRRIRIFIREKEKTEEWDVGISTLSIRKSRQEGQSEPQDPENGMADAP